MQRITNNMLNSKIEYLNQISGNPVTPWNQDDGKMQANIGNYHLSGAYGGVNLHQMMNDGGGIHSTFSCGHIPKRELYEKLCAFVSGYETAKQAA